jgi:glyoxylase-like metal-dependent hydrolase (beta-lactamase superfamily II)
LRVVGLHPDVLVATSRVYQTNCTIVRGRRAGDDATGGGAAESFVIDSPVFPDELEILPALMEQAGFALTGLLTTHADWDHLLGRLAFPDAALGGGETTAARLAAEPGDAARRLRAFDEEFYVDRAERLSLGQVQALPVPGVCEIGDEELILEPADGHTADGTAYWVPWARVLVAGDYLSPVEIPMISRGGSRSAYRATLERLRVRVEEADWVVPGHGEPLDGDRALAILREDLSYLETGTLPIARRNAPQKAIDAANRERWDT